MGASDLEQRLKDPEELRVFQQERLLVEITQLMCRTMKDRGVKRAQLAEKVGRTKGRITQILNGEANLTLRTVADIFTALEKKLKVSSEELFVDAEPLHFVAMAVQNSRPLCVNWEPLPVAGPEIAQKLAG